MSDATILRDHGHRLTVNEREVLELVVRGFSQRQIALARGLSRSTVQSQIKSAIERLRVVVAETEGKHESLPVAVVDAGGDRREEREAAPGARGGDPSERPAPVGSRRAPQAAPRHPGGRQKRERGNG